MSHLGRGAMVGAIGGFGATLLMSAVMIAGRRLGLSAQLPPDRIAEEVIETATDRRPSEDEELVVASILHLGFGTAAGVAFGIGVAGVRGVPAAALAGGGALYASGIWLVSYQGWVPHLHLMPPASRDDRGRVATMLLAHWVYGIALGLAVGPIRRWLS